MKDWKQNILPVQFINMLPTRMPRKKKKKDFRTRWKQAIKKLPREDIKYCLLFDGKGNEIIS